MYGQVLELGLKSTIPSGKLGSDVRTSGYDILRSWYGVVNNRVETEGHPFEETCCYWKLEELWNGLRIDIDSGNVKT